MLNNLNEWIEIKHYDVFDKKERSNIEEKFDTFLRDLYLLYFTLI